MTQTIDVTGLPEAVVRDIRQLVATVRETLPPAGGADTRPPNELTAEEWVARLRAWAASHKPVDWEVDVSRDAIYQDRGQ